MKYIIFYLFFTYASILYCQSKAPKILHNVTEKNGNFYFLDVENDKLFETKDINSKYSIYNFWDCIQGSDNGIDFDFSNRNFKGKIIWGFYPLNSAKAQYPIFFRNPAIIKDGKAEINLLKEISKKHDIADYLNKEKFKFGYRVIDNDGNIIYDGKANFKGKGPFELTASITEGPFVNMLTDNSAVISFRTNYKRICSVVVNDTVFKDTIKTDRHEISINGLKPSTKYKYTVQFDDNTESSVFTTTPITGTRKPFTFAFSSDCRQGVGGGERNIWGVNSYIMKKLSALAINENSAFVQFTGDVIQGYLTNPKEMQLQYTNFKRTIEPFAHSIPFYIGLGNHEAIVSLFNDGSNFGLAVNRFPYELNSTEKLFADEFVNFLNGPDNEDGNKYDPDLGNIDFPTYKENVYHYVYDNIAMIVLNSNYLYTVSTSKLDKIGGNAHGYVMDNQLKWFEEVIKQFENDKNIDHIFVTIHTPAFPNGGHVDSDMWYNGSNDIRPFIAGKPTDRGIIERRDDLLDIMINRSKKTVALLCGDEHNYSRLLLNSQTNIYPENWNKSRISISRPFWQITNGSAGAPYYSQEIVPWSNDVKFFSNQYALCLFDINKKKVSLRVIDPDTLEEIEEVVLK